MSQRERLIEELCSLGESLREKIDKRGIRNINDPLTEEAFDQERDRIQIEVINRMEEFLRLYKQIGKR